MAELEQGAIANPDENRMVGHYWLRNPSLAPTPAIRRRSRRRQSVKAFAAEVHSGARAGRKAVPKPAADRDWRIGVGAAVRFARAGSSDARQAAVFRVRQYRSGRDRQGVGVIGNALGERFALSSRNRAAPRRPATGCSKPKRPTSGPGLIWPSHAVAVTQEGSELDKSAAAAQWIKRFPMWDWVGGRTSELSAVGLLPAALQGFDIDGLLRGARACDAVTRSRNVKENPSAQLAMLVLCR